MSNLNNNMKLYELSNFTIIIRKKYKNENIFLRTQEFTVKFLVVLKTKMFTPFQSLFL